MRYEILPWFPFHRISRAGVLHEFIHIACERASLPIPDPRSGVPTQSTSFVVMRVCCFPWSSFHHAFISGLPFAFFFILHYYLGCFYISSSAGLSHCAP